MAVPERPPLPTDAELMSRLLIAVTTKFDQYGNHLALFLGDIRNWRPDGGKEFFRNNLDLWRHVLSWFERQWDQERNDKARYSMGRAVESLMITIDGDLAEKLEIVRLIKHVARTSLEPGLSLSPIVHAAVGNLCHAPSAAVALLTSSPHKSTAWQSIELLCARNALDPRSGELAQLCAAKLTRAEIEYLAAYHLSGNGNHLSVEQFASAYVRLAGPPQTEGGSIFLAALSELSEQESIWKAFDKAEPSLLRERGLAK